MKYVLLVHGRKFSLNVMTKLCCFCRLSLHNPVQMPLQVCRRGLPVLFGDCRCLKLTGNSISYTHHTCAMMYMCIISNSFSLVYNLIFEQASDAVKVCHMVLFVKYYL